MWPMLFISSPTHTILLPETLTRAPNVTESASENSPQQKHD